MLKPEVIKGWPPGGWIFYQPETNWHAPNPLQFTFAQQVNNIIAMRKQNPRFNLSTEWLVVSQQLQAYTAARLHYDPKFCLIAATQAVRENKKKISSTSPLHLREVDAADERSGRVDPSAIIEWLGDGGKPVSVDRSESRASVCAECPKNSSSPNCPESERPTWKRWFTKTMAAGLKRYIEIKNHLKLSTTKDEVLGKCLACHCELPLKVHTPIEHIVDNMDEETKKELEKVPWCWVIKEQ